MDAAAMSEGVGADDRFGPLNLHAREPGDQAAGGDDSGGIYFYVQAEIGGTSTNGHNHIFAGGIPSTLAKAVDAGINALGTVAQGLQSVGNGQAEIIMAVGGDAHAGELLAHISDKLAKLPGQGETDRIAERDKADALFKQHIADLQDKVMLGTGGIFQSKIDILGIGTSLGHSGAGQFTHLIAGLAKLDLTMEGGNADKGLDNGMRSNLDGFPGALDISGVGATNGADFSILNFGGDETDSLEFPGRGDGEAAVEGIKAHIS